MAALWKDRLAERLELQELSQEETAALLRAVLGGEADPATAYRLWESAAGNPLFLREPVLGGLSDGALEQTGGVWALRGHLTAPPPLRRSDLRRRGGGAPGPRRRAAAAAAVPARHWLSLLGWTRRTRGELSSAAGCFQQAAALQRQLGPVGLLRWNLAALALALAQRGAPEEAAAALA
ncbi:MAG: hypothetical protein ACRDUY_03585, partial [Nitriliruptorales bacterium]